MKFLYHGNMRPYLRARAERRSKTRALARKIAEEMRPEVEALFMAHTPFLDALTRAKG